MKITLEDFFKNSFVLSIDRDRLNLFYELFKKYFKNIKHNLPRPYRGFKKKGNTGGNNIKLSHESIVRMAKALDLPFVVILEDDAYPRRDAELKLSEIINDIPDETSILILGWTKKKGKIIQSPDIGKTNSNVRLFNHGSLWGTHSYVVFNKFYDKFLQAYDSNVKLAADNYVGMFKEVSVIYPDPIFIQFCRKKTIHNEIGYTFSATNGERVYRSKPPLAFDTYIEEDKKEDTNG
jgi:hypothetical protein